MGTWLKKSTAVEVALGPFVDSTDGFTPETGLTVTQAEVRLKKNGGDWAQKNEATSLVHEENGWYRCLLDDTDTATAGILVVAVYESGALPVWHEFMVLPANVYDSLVGGSDLLDVSLVQWKGSDPNVLVSGRLDASVGAMASDVVDAAAVKADAVTEIQSGLATASVLTAVKAKTDLIPAAPAAVGDIPTATQNADALLKRDMSAVTGEGARSPLNALRKLMNKWSISGSTLTVCKEDDAATAFTQTITSVADAEPVTGLDTVG